LRKILFFVKVADKKMFHGMFANYGIIGLYIFLVSFAIAVILGIILSVVLKNKWLFSLTMLVAGAYYFFKDMVQTAILYLGVAIIVSVILFFVKKKK
jgi:hypothetical protein